jgi:pantetheine-phosphate adenylyltransferase
MKKEIFPGSFDPITLVHYDIVMRASELFDEVYVALGVNSSKQRSFPVDVCMNMIEDAFSKKSNIKVVKYQKLTVEFCKDLGVKYVVRGIRTVRDFEYERSLAEMNRKMYPGLETIYLDSRPEYLSISSTIIRDLVRNKADISPFVPKEILKYID